MDYCIDWNNTFDSADTRAGRKLIRAFNQQVASYVGGNALKKIAIGLHDLVGGYLGDEVADLAELLDCEPKDVLLANVIYDVTSSLLGCSTFVTPTQRGPLHARNLDWWFRGDLLRKHTTVFTFPSRHGDYLVVTWPGLFGVLTGMAPGRYSVSVNHITDHRSNFIAAPALAWHAVNGYMPVTWAVREVLETKKTFAAAVKYLSEVPLLAPVLITVAGTDNDERVVIERDPDDAVLRWPDDDGVLAVTNHCVDEDDDDAGDSEERFEFLQERLGRHPPTTADAALKLLSNDALFQDDGGFKTEHQVVMEPRTGRLTVRAPGRRKEIYEGGKRR